MKITNSMFFTLIFILFSIFAKSQDKNSLFNKYLIVLDVQEYYTNGTLTEFSTQKVIDSINYVIGKTNIDNVIYINRIHKVLNLSLSFPFIYVSLDSSAMQFDRRLQLVNKIIFTREKANAFKINKLNDFLMQNNATEIIIIGFLAEDFLYDSAILGKKLGYNIYLIPNAILGKKEKTKTKAIKKLSNLGVEVITNHPAIIDKTRKYPI